MYKVIGHPRTRALRVLWMLEELGEAYEIDPAYPHTPAMRAANPLGKAPALVDGDATLQDSVAIVTYLADKHRRFTAPCGTVARGVQDGITQFTVDALEGPLWTMAKNSFVNPEEHRCDAIKPVCVFEVQKALKGLDRLLGEREFAAGDDFTIADLLLAHTLAWVGLAKLEIEQPNIKAYRDRMLARRALARARERGDAALEQTA